MQWTGLTHFKQTNRYLGLGAPSGAISVAPMFPTSLPPAYGYTLLNFYVFSAGYLSFVWSPVIISHPHLIHSHTAAAKDEYEASASVAPRRLSPTSTQVLVVKVYEPPMIFSPVQSHAKLKLQFQSLKSMLPVTTNQLAKVPSA